MRPAIQLSAVLVLASAKRSENLSSVFYFYIRIGKSDKTGHENEYELTEY